jgi:hypothetical protein
MSFQSIVRSAQELHGGLAIGGTPIFKEYTLSEYLDHEHGKVLNCKQLQQPGRALAALFREASGGREPGTKLQEVNGRQTNVKAYTDQQIEGAERGVTGFSLMSRIVEEVNLL